MNRGLMMVAGATVVEVSSTPSNATVHASHLTAPVAQRSAGGPLSGRQLLHVLDVDVSRNHGAGMADGLYMKDTIEWCPLGEGYGLLYVRPAAGDVALHLHVDVSTVGCRHFLQL